MSECLHSGFATDDDRGGGDNWSYKELQSSFQLITTNKPTPSFLDAGCPSCCPTMSDSTDINMNIITVIITIIIIYYIYIHILFIPNRNISSKTVSHIQQHMMSSKQTTCNT